MSIQVAHRHVQRTKPDKDDVSPFIAALERFQRAAKDYGRIKYLREHGDASYAEYELAWRSLMAAQQSVIDTRFDGFERAWEE